MAIIEDVFRQVFLQLRELTDRILDLESEHGEVHGVHFGNSFPGSPYPNQIVIRTDEIPPTGGVIYRYDSATSSWMRLN